MNLSALTAREVLRICVPETDLERRLFDICKELEGESDDAKDDAEQARRELENHDCDLYDDIRDMKSAIKKVCDLIEQGKTQDGVNILKEI